MSESKMGCCNKTLIIIDSMVMLLRLRILAQGGSRILAQGGRRTLRVQISFEMGENSMEEVEDEDRYVMWRSRTWIGEPAFPQRSPQTAQT